MNQEIKKKIQLYDFRCNNIFFFEEEINSKQNNRKNK